MTNMGGDMTHYNWIWCPLYGERFHAWYCDTGEKSMTGVIVAPTVEPDILILLKDHVFKMTYKYLSLYPYT